MLSLDGTNVRLPAHSSMLSHLTHECFTLSIFATGRVDLLRRLGITYAPISRSCSLNGREFTYSAIQCIMRGVVSALQVRYCLIQSKQCSKDCLVVDISYKSDDDRTNWGIYLGAILGESLLRLKSWNSNCHSEGNDAFSQRNEARGRL